MLNDSRIDIYDYLYGLIHGVVSDNVYRMGEPTENTTSDTEDGFIVINVGNINDDSEFSCEAHAQVRCFIVAYVPKKTKGRLNSDKYRFFEEGIKNAIKEEIANGTNENYYIMDDGIISMEDDETTQKGNQYHIFVKSFIVGIDNIQ